MQSIQVNNIPGVRPGRWSISLNTMQGNSEILWLYENSMGPNYIYSYSKSHAYSRSDFGPAEAAGRSQTRPMERESMCGS